MALGYFFIFFKPHKSRNCIPISIAILSLSLLGTKLITGEVLSINAINTFEFERFNAGLSVASFYELRSQLARPSHLTYQRFLFQKLQFLIIVI